MERGPEGVLPHGQCPEKRPVLLAGCPGAPALPLGTVREGGLGVPVPLQLGRGPRRAEGMPSPPAEDAPQQPAEGADKSGFHSAFVRPDGQPGRPDPGAGLPSPPASSRGAAR